MAKDSILDQNLLLPDAPDFISEPIQYSVTEMIQMCEPMLRFWNEIRYSRREPDFLGEAFKLEQDIPESDKIKIDTRE